VGLLQHVLDDDDRTRRADALLSHFTIWLVVLATVGVVVGLVMLNSSPWASAGAGSVGALAALWTWWRRRRRLTGSGSTLAADGSPELGAVDEGDTEATAAG
jgi:membrane protein implicated in regulation of membrane protease activity